MKKIRTIPSVVSIASLSLALSLGAHGDTATSDGKADATSSKAISFPLSYTGEGLSNLSGGYKTGAIYEGLLDVGIQGDLEKLMGWKGATFLVSAIDTQGPSLTNKFVHDFNAVSGIDAYDSIRLYETWFQQELDDGKVSIRLGQLLSDTEFCVADHGAVFVNAAFGAIPLISHNWNSPVYPMAAPAARLRVSPTDTFSMQAAIFEGDVGEQGGNNKHGVSWRLNSESGAFIPVEFAYKINSEKESTGLPGVYKLGGFYHTAQFDDSEGGAPHQGDYGLYAVADQQLWRVPGSQDQGLSAFTRVGCAPPDRNAVPFYGETGLSYKGLLPRRENDVTGIACYYTRLSDKVRDEDGIPNQSHHESVLEATYKVAVKDWFSVQPDFQYVFTPSGSREIGHAMVAGIRFNLSFQ